MLYFPTPPAAMSAANARNAISQMNLYGYTTQSMIPSRRMEMEARGRFMAANPMAAAAYGTLPMPVGGNGGNGGGRAARLRWSDREKISNNKTAAASSANDNEAGEDADEEEEVDENRNSKGGGGRATRNKSSAGG